MSSLTSQNKEEEQYLTLVENILSHGSKEVCRNGTTLSIFGNMMRFNLQNGKIPFLTHKRLAWRTCFNELIWFLRGRTDNEWLTQRGVHIWDANSTREFLDSRGLTNYKEGELGPIYGYQWRHFNAPYIKQENNESNHLPTETKQMEGIDQLQGIIDALCNTETRTSRRLIMTAWNPCQLNEMALPPCHILCQFNVSEGNKLSCALYQRSGDVGLGVPFNIASYSALTHLLATHCGLEAHEFVYFLGNAHIYEEHIEELSTLKERNTFEFPIVKIKEKKEKIEEYEIEDFIIEKYQYDKTPLILKMMA